MASAIEQFILAGPQLVGYISRPMQRPTLKKTLKTKPQGALESCARS